MRLVATSKAGAALSRRDRLPQGVPFSSLKSTTILASFLLPPGQRHSRSPPQRLLRWEKGHGLKTQHPPAGGRAPPPGTLLITAKDPADPFYTCSECASSNGTRAQWRSWSRPTRCWGAVLSAVTLGIGAVWALRRLLYHGWSCDYQRPQDPSRPALLLFCAADVWWVCQTVQARQPNRGVPNALPRLPAPCGCQRQSAGEGPPAAAAGCPVPANPPEPSAIHRQCPGLWAGTTRLESQRHGGTQHARRTLLGPRVPACEKASRPSCCATP